MDLIFWSSVHPSIEISIQSEVILGLKGRRERQRKE